jgi:futalosine hydrolase
MDAFDRSHEPPQGSATLLLIPTDLERERFLDLGGLEPGLAQVETCGFGPVAAAARTAQLLARLRPARAMLVGIAGAYDDVDHPVGEALEFSAVAIEGIGVGEGADLIAPPELGFPQWPGHAASAHGAAVGEISDRLPLAAEEEGAPLLLTTCAASAGPDQARLRRERFPEAAAEDMEGFAVAMACALAHVPLRIVRGISNRVGDRDPGHWRIPAALAASRRLALAILRSTDPWKSVDAPAPQR